MVAGANSLIGSHGLDEMAEGVVARPRGDDERLATADSICVHVRHLRIKLSADKTYPFTLPTISPAM